MLADCLECLLQRCLDYKTTAVRIAYRHLKAVLLDPDINKVVLIGHSQGAIIASLVLDQLLAELPVSCMSKLEIYTFGSAASHFSNPLLFAPGAQDNSAASSCVNEASGEEQPSRPKHVLGHIEHYANEYDLICRWGVLHCTESELNHRYAGSVFVRMGATGHMLNQHYLNNIFPIPGVQAPDGPRAGFLDSLLATDATLAMKRESAAVDKAESMKHACSMNAGKRDNAMVRDALKGDGESMEREGQGGSVRDVSRLWRYLDGKSPSSH